MTSGLGDASVKARTGKRWKEWLAVLDRAGARRMKHLEIARYLASERGLGPWWSQMVTVGIERTRGMR